HQAIELAAGLEQVQPSQGGDDLLVHLLALAHAVGNLQVTVLAGGFEPEEHRQNLDLQPKADLPAKKKEKKPLKRRICIYISPSRFSNRPGTR
ncbi:MAG: hypothetical protein M3463_18135, partial [Verrucomicrobiota bacterium]|nr:hypothetical protein [Verrucomicrobiota bacterium]